MTAVTYVTFLLTRQYTKNPELCNVRCGDEFGLELNWNYDSVEELGRLACFLKCRFFSLCPNARQPGKVLNT